MAAVIAVCPLAGYAGAMEDTASPKLGQEQHSSGAFEIGRTYQVAAFVALQVRCPANRIEQCFPIDLNLEVDEWRLQIDRQQGLLHRFTDRFLDHEGRQSSKLELRVRLRHCYVRYSCEGMSINAASKYRSAVEVGAYSEKQAASDHSSSTRERTGMLSAGAKLGMRPTASGEASYRIGSRWQGSATVERTITASQDIYEVEAVPSGWRIGDRIYGDPLKRDGCLNGPYFARPAEAYAYSCLGEFLPRRDSGTIRFDVTTHDGLYIEATGGEVPSVADRDVAIASMRDKLAAICVERALADGDEMTLCSVNVTCRSGDDLASSATGKAAI